MNTYASVSDINNRMISVYNNMFLAVVNSMLVSLLVASSPALMAFLFTGIMKWVVIFAPLVMLFAMTWIMEKATYGEARGMLHVFAALMGLEHEHYICDLHHGQHCRAHSLEPLCCLRTMSLWGYFTKKEFGRVGQFLVGGTVIAVADHQHCQRVHWQ
jgi:uncharacterized protein